MKHFQFPIYNFQLESKPGGAEQSSRRQAGLIQAELARRAAIRPETMNRVEKGKTTPDTATIAKIERALETAQGGGE